MDSQPYENIFYKDNMINIICVSVDEERATNLAKLITGCELIWKGYWIREQTKDNLRLLSYTRWPDIQKGRPTTTYADTMVVDVSDINEFSKVEEYVRARGRVPQILLYSQTDLTELEKTFRHHNAKWINNKEVLGERLREIIVTHYFELLKLIRETFDKFDINKNGVIEKEDIKKAANELGENITSVEFEKCFEIMDMNNDGVICFSEFVNWWKLGRQNTSLMKKMVQLQMMTSKILKNDKLIELRKELEALKTENSLSKFFLKMFSEGEIHDPGFELFFQFVKGEERYEHIRTHLLHFQQDTAKLQSRWTDLTLAFDDTVDQNLAFEQLKEVKTKLLGLLEVLSPNAHETLTRLFKFEYFKFFDNNSVVIRMRNKADTQKQIDTALNDLIQLLKTMTTTQEFSFGFRTKSSFGDVLKDRIKLIDALADYSLEIKSSLHRSILKVICGGLYKDLETLISVLLSPLSTKFESHLKMETLLESLKVDFESFNNNVLIVQSFVGIIKGLLNNNILDKLKAIEICFNGFEIYSSLRLKLNDVFN
jgi:hypothetical protein